MLWYIVLLTLPFLKGEPGIRRKHCGEENSQQDEENLKIRHGKFLVGQGRDSAVRRFYMRMAIGSMKR